MLENNLLTCSSAVAVLALNSAQHSKKHRQPGSPWRWLLDSEKPPVQFCWKIILVEVSPSLWAWGVACCASCFFGLIIVNSQKCNVKALLRWAQTILCMCAFCKRMLWCYICMSLYSLSGILKWVEPGDDDAQNLILVELLCRQHVAGAAGCKQIGPESPVDTSWLLPAWVALSMLCACLQNLGLFSSQHKLKCPEVLCIVSGSHLVACLFIGCWARYVRMYLCVQPYPPIYLTVDS